LSSNAFRIRSTSPLVAYQFNNVANAHSNDASLLLPRNALGTSYRTLSWYASTTVPALGIKPDRSYVTIVGIEPNTHVDIRLGTRMPGIVGNGPIPAAQKGEAFSVTLGPFDVLNLETADGSFSDLKVDITGTGISSDLPIAVFSGVERGIAPLDGYNDPPPGWNGTDQNGGQSGTTLCCTDHLEEQLLPLSSLGKELVITRSPVRSSSGSWIEPDIARFVGAAESTQVTTTLPAPDNAFTLQPGEVRDVRVKTDFTVNATAPVMVGQILVSQTYCDRTGAYLGDPSLTIFASIDQYRSDYLFLVPASWAETYVVVAAPVGANVTIDGSAPTGCIVTHIGPLGNVDWESRRCPLPDGAHRMAGDRPFGIVAYGYGRAGSYAMLGGADVKPIYVPPSIK
jgi:hypothetical protein